MNLLRRNRKKAQKTKVNLKFFIEHPFCLKVKKNSFILYVNIYTIFKRDQYYFIWDNNKHI